MGKVECFEIPGLELIFFSSDHLPPHIHVRKPGHWGIRVFFMECSEGVFVAKEEYRLKRRGPTGGDVRDILSQVLAHRVELLEEWERKVITK